MLSLLSESVEESELQKSEFFPNSCNSKPLLCESGVGTLDSSESEIVQGMLGRGTKAVRAARVGRESTVVSVCQ